MTQEQLFQCKMKAFDNAISWGRLVASLAAGIIALSATFLKDMVGQNGIVAVWLLYLAWALLFIAVISGTLLVGAIGKYLFKTKNPDELNMQDKAFMPYAYAEQFSFWFGLPLLVIFMGLNI